MKKLMEKFSGKNLKKTAGFTLIEILVVIGIIAVLAAIVIVAINPAKQFAQARNTQREASVNTILNAIGQKVADNKGLFAGGTPACPAITGLVIGTTVGAGFTDLSCLTPTYIPTAIPTDPGGTVGGVAKAVGTAADTGYTVTVDANGRFTVCAPNHAEDAIPGSAAYCLTR